MPKAERRIWQWNRWNSYYLRCWTILQRSAEPASFEFPGGERRFLPFLWLLELSEYPDACSSTCARLCFCLLETSIGKTRARLLWYWSRDRARCLRGLECNFTKYVRCLIFVKRLEERDRPDVGRFLKRYFKNILKRSISNKIFCLV